ncbi:hypothetical protein BaRGS_00004691 [Batillaria attramentaria]|uniref:Uncharacterized protein n=1 Tax=Batillaria attramentaria TaxID=370345 RepID=A0ABD0L6S3_9CAEN
MRTTLEAKDSNSLDPLAGRLRNQVTLVNPFHSVSRGGEVEQVCATLIWWTITLSPQPTHQLTTGNHHDALEENLSTAECQTRAVNTFAYSCLNSLGSTVKKAFAPARRCTGKATVLMSPRHLR